MNITGNRPVLFISDLHLDEQRPETTRAFLNFLKEQATAAQHLFILGDFFEAWIGDDHRSSLGEQVCQGLAELSEQQTEVFFMPGNRDFLLGSDYLSRANTTLLPDPFALKLDGEVVVLSHGDALCTDDIQYQAIRKQLRSHEWQQQFLRQSIEQRLEFAANARKESQAYTQSASVEIMDVNQQAVDSLMDEHSTNLLIHGHTHRPDVHEWTHAGFLRARYVLGDWYEQGSVLVWSDQGFKLNFF